MANGGVLIAIAALVALIGWLFYDRPVSATTLQAQQVTSLTQLQTAAPASGFGTPQGLIGLSAVVAALVAAIFLMAGRRTFALVATLVTGILLADGLAAVHLGMQAADSWANLINQAYADQNPIAEAIFDSAQHTVNVHSVIPAIAVVIAAVIGLLGSLIAVVGALRRQSTAPTSSLASTRTATT
jgi:hypothetical protein